MAERAVIVEIPGLVWDGGAPMPVLISTDHRTLIAFYVPDRDVTDGLEVQTAEFNGCASVMFGFPNDEVLHGHRLHGHGLEWYGLHVIEESTWIAELVRIERVHDRAPAEPFAGSKHYLLAFHDSTLEAIAEDLVPLARYRYMDEAVAALVTLARPPGGYFSGPASDDEPGPPS